MPRHVEITLGETTFKAGYFLFGQAVEIQDALLAMASSELKRQIDGNCQIIAAGLSEHHPEMTSEALLNTRGTTAQLVAATRAILSFNEYQVEGDAGKVRAAARAA
jgi:hypothetical protein